MAQLRRSHPWNPGYVIPQNVRDEPFGQGVITTDYTPRGTISMLQPDWLERGTGLQVAAKVDKKKTLGSLGNSVFQSPKRAGNGSLGCTSLSGSSIHGSSLGDDSAYGERVGPIQIGGASDPIANFGRDGARAIIDQMKTVPAELRSQAMRSLFDAIDPQLWSLVATKTEMMTGKGYPPSVALEKALAASLSNRLVDQFTKIGNSPGAPVAMNGLLGIIDPARRVQALNGFWSDLGDKISGAASSVYGAAKSAVNTLGNLACRVASNPNTAQVATAINPTAGAGASVAGSLCGAPNATTTAQQQAAAQAAAYAAMQQQQSSLSSMLPMIAIGGIALVAVVLVARR